MTISFDGFRPFDVAGVRRRKIGAYTGPASYATGGDDTFDDDVGVDNLEHVDFEVATDGISFRLLLYDHTNAKVVWIVPDTGAEVSNATDLSAFSARFEALGY